MRIGYSCIRASAQAAGRGTRRKRSSADLAAAGESVVRELLKGLPLLGKRLVMVAGLLILPLTCRQDKAAAGESIAAKAPDTINSVTRSGPSAPDPRTIRLRRFFNKLRCPVIGMADDFVQASDDNHLDWRLLPSISIIESGGGKAYRNNNIFGWDNGLTLFPSIRAGLNLVAFKLGQSPIYRNRDIPGKLHLYNPDETYAGRVMDVMNRISPQEDLTPARHLVRRSSEFVYVAN